jgi:hypothetical protein
LPGHSQSPVSYQLVPNLSRQFPACPCQFPAWCHPIHCQLQAPSLPPITIFSVGSIACSSLLVTHSSHASSQTLPYLIPAPFLPDHGPFPASSLTLPCQLQDPKFPATHCPLPCQLQAPFRPSSLTPSLPAPSPFPSQLTDPFPASSFSPYTCRFQDPSLPFRRLFPGSSMTLSLPAHCPLPCQLQAPFARQLTDAFPASFKPFQCKLLQVPAPLPTRPPSLPVLILYPAIIQLLLLSFHFSSFSLPFFSKLS